MPPSRKKQRPSNASRVGSGSGADRRPAAGSSGGSNRKEAEQLIETAAELDAEERVLLQDEVPPSLAPEPDVDIVRLRTAVAEAERARALARRRETNHVDAKADLERRRDGLERRFTDDRAALEKSIADQRDELDRERAEHQTRVAQQDERSSELDGKAAELADRLAAAQKLKSELFSLEQAAKSDFAEYRDQKLQDLAEEMDGRRGAAQAHQESLDKKAAERRAAEDKKQLTRADELEKQAVELDQRYRQLLRDQRRVAAQEEFLTQALDDGRKEAEARLGTELDTTRQEALSWRQRHDTMRELAERRASQLAERERAELEAGHRPLPEVQAELNEVRHLYDELRRQVDSQGTATPERLAAIEGRCQDLVVEREDLLRQNEELRRTVAATQISVVERENARAVNHALQELNGVLQREIDEHTAKLEKLQAASTKEPPFPACSEMDRDELCQTVPEMPRSMPPLKQFVERVRNLIASQFGLYYTARDMRCFLAGLAASRLHLLQGISGTGKTRLPNVFAEVIGARCETIAVAAEWRSPQDLLGYYNAFERKFYETEFTKALYRAQLPLYAQKPFFIVLDEMNLSHPEQYFSSILSALGNEDKKLKRLPLMTSRVEPTPERLIDGQYLDLPPNAWFLGTANHDETTVGFADKTYDRANVLELPIRREVFDPGQPQPLTPISLAALDREFTKAADGGTAGAEAVLDYFDTVLGPRLRNKLKVSWGNRLEEQARAFVPVVVAADGPLGEAADHLLATKVLRKLQGRVELPTAELKALMHDVQSTWDKLCDKSIPEQSMTVLEDALRDKDMM
jgi:hypothetical protein